MIDKHAYMILCHTNFEQLILLLKLLDYENNDIYIHIDKKVTKYPYEKIKNAVSKSRLFFSKRINVNWGGYSQIRAELILLKMATKTNHSYYHLISGACLPLHSQEYIHDFFRKNQGKEFIRAENISDVENRFLIFRLKTYHFFQEQIGRNQDDKDHWYYSADRRLQKIQRLIGINRIQERIEYYYGDQWFSVTEDLAKYIIENEKKIRKYMKYSICVDEIIIQTLAMMSPYKNNIVGNCCRLIDWNRGRPYIFREDDYSQLINSKMIFARKFDINVDAKIINMLSEYIVNQK